MILVFELSGGVGNLLYYFEWMNDAIQESMLRAYHKQGQTFCAGEIKNKRSQKDWDLSGIYIETK